MGLNIAVSGTNGFLGTHLCRYLKEVGHNIRPISRKTPPNLEGCDVVVHLAAKVHVLQTTNADEATFERDNVKQTLKLAEDARAQGVKRFVFISTIGVHGNASAAPLRENSPAQPIGGYAHSKWRGEEALRKMEGIEMTILRPPLIYGPGVKANFLSLMKAVYWGIPLPFRSIDNPRDYISATNMCSAIEFVSTHESAANETFLLRDGDPFSTAALAHKLGAAMERPYCLWPVPLSLLKFGAKIIGKASLYESVCLPREIDDSKLRAMGWQPPQSAEQGLRETAGWFKETRQ